MRTVATTSLSTKGQVVIPEEVRERLGLRAGVQFVVVGEGDVVILKVISPPSKTEFTSLLKKARSDARRAGMRKRDVAKAVRKVRSRR